MQAFYHLCEETGNRISKADADDFLWSVEEQVDLDEVSMDYVLTVLPHFLAVGRMNGTPPPFGLLDFIETAGVANLNPEPLPVAHLVDRLLEDVPPARRTPAAVAKAVRSSRSWPDDHSFMASWFEDGATVNALLDGQRLSAARRTALVLEDLLPVRRGRWAEALAWSALMLREGEDETDAWMDFAIVAGELLGDRPLGDIGLMHGVAKGTVESWRSRRG